MAKCSGWPRPCDCVTETGVLSFISTTTIFGTPVDVTLQELAVESFFPADAQTAEALRALSAGFRLTPLAPDLRIT